MDDSGLYYRDSSGWHGPIKWIEVGNYSDSRRFNILRADLSSDTIRFNHSDINLSGRSFMVGGKSLYKQGTTYLEKVYVKEKVKARSMSMSVIFWGAVWTVLVWLIGTVTGKNFRESTGIGEIM